MGHGVNERLATIIILCWNRWKLTELLLRTLRQNTVLTDVEVIVFDNGSTDETAKRLQGMEWVRTIRSEVNLGFAGGNNAAIRAARPESDVVLLNNDVAIHQPGWLSLLSDAAHSSDDIGIVGCRLVLPDGRLLHAGTYILPDTMWGQQIGSLEKDVNQYPALRNVQGVVFACAYIRRETLDRIGLLSEEYFAYFEDTDYCLRAREAGLRTVCCGEVTLMHDEHGSTRGSPAVFEAIFCKSRKVFSRRWGAALQERYRRDLTWQSIINRPTGYAMSCREILRALDRAGTRVRYEYAYDRRDFGRESKDIAGDPLLSAIAHRRVPRRPPVSVVYAHGDVFRKNRGKYKIGYTMLEVDGFPAEWVRQANTMDEVWVPCDFNRHALVRSGVTKPVHVMPLGVDVDHFHPEIVRYPSPRGEYVFMTNFEWGERKQPELLLKVFNQIFSAREPVVLICKVMNRDRRINVRGSIRTMRLKKTGGRIAMIYNREFPYHQMAAFYRSADCYISAGRGEGWDMPLVEAMACGLPAIATDWGAHTQFITGSNSYPLRIRGTIPAKSVCPYYDGFTWADPDPEHLSFLLRHIFENAEEARRKGQLAAAEMRACWTWHHAARRIIERLDSIQS